MKCPDCGDDTHLYRNAEMMWLPELGEWKLTYVHCEVECTECDHQFDYEGDFHG
jgi:ribosomal protein S27E